MSYILLEKPYSTEVKNFMNYEFFKLAAEYEEKKKKKGPGLGTALLAGAVIAGGATYAANKDVRDFVNTNVGKAKDWAFKSPGDITIAGSRVTIPSRASMAATKVKELASTAGSATKDTAKATSNKVQELSNKAYKNVNLKVKEFKVNRTDTLSEATNAARARVIPDYNQFSGQGYGMLALEKAQRIIESNKNLDRWMKSKF